MKYSKIILLAGVMVILIGGSTLLYSQLSQSYGRKNLSTTEVPKGDAEEAVREEYDKAEPQNEEESGSSEEETRAPDYTMEDAAGEKIALSSKFGKPIVMNFWASWCGPCKMEMPDFQEAFETYGEDVTFLMVNLTDGERETEEIAEKFIQEQGYTFPVYYDVFQEGSREYGVSSIPTTYFIDAQGNVKAYAAGMLDGETLESGMDMIYTERNEK